MQGLLVVAQVDAFLHLKLLGCPVNDPLVEVVAAQEGVAVGRLDLKDAVAHFQNGDVECATAQVIDGDHTLVLVAQAIGQRRGRRLVDDAQHLQPGDLARVFGGLALAVVEVSRHGDDRLGHRLAQIRLGVGFDLLQDHGRNLRRRILAAVHDHPNIAVRSIAHLIGGVGLGALHFRVAELAPHEALHRSNCILRVDDRLPLGHLTHQALGRLRVHGHHRRKEPTAFRTGNDDRLPAFHHSHDGVCRAQVDTDYRCH